MFGHRKYTPEANDFFDDVAALFISLASFNTAIESFWNSSATRIPLSPEHTLNLYGRTVNVSFRSYDLMHGVVRDVWPTEIEAFFQPPGSSPVPITTPVSLQASGVQTMLTQLVGTAFLKFYERNAHRVKAAYPNGPKTWPAEWRLVWHVRNAIAHGDCFAITDLSFPATTWNGITVSPSDNGANWFAIEQHLAGGDVLALMEALDGHTL